MKRPVALAAFFAHLALCAQASSQAQPDLPGSVISVRSTLVVVPALVKTKSGELVYTLRADDFTVKDDGVPQTLRLEEDTDAQPLAMVVVVETGGDGVRHLQEYQALGPLLDAIVGNVPHKIAVVGFDSEPVLLQDFSTDLGKATAELNQLEAGDDGAAVLDGLSFATEMLRKQPATYRRAILLLSETLDQGSHIELTDALHALSDTNTSIYALGFGSTKAQIKHEGTKFNSSEPGPRHGCFSRDDDTDSKPSQSRGEQSFDCLAQLLPPLRLAKMVEIATRNSLRKNVPETCARLSGGEYFNFKDGKSLRRGLFTISNDVPNRYVLTFHPQSPHAGLHALTVELHDRPDLRIDARTEYWVDDPGAAPASK
ncbi:MAG TPA: VWA domain-containing protein [Acidobacteriaceae bacterium]|jgi:VWFA-related protein|nr:VWA domain-containing protein [Acidobacteriaceae bacterium]